MIKRPQVQGSGDWEACGVKDELRSDNNMVVVLQISVIRLDVRIYGRVLGVDYSRLFVTSKNRRS